VVSLPRHFVARPPGAPQPVTPAPPRHALDVFRLADAQANAHERVLAAGVDGRLQLLESDNHQALPPFLLAQLSHHEVASGARTRTINASELFVFNVQLVEQPAGTPGLNDPVYLYGALTGPFPLSAGPAACVEGQLTVTRADVLAGLVDGAAHAFRCSGDAAQARCFHMLLPADRDDVILQGRGLVLAYALHPGELMLEDPSNGALITQVLHDLLRALQQDMKADGLKHPLVETVLPVPSRAALEGELEMQGYVIKGDVATRRKGTSAGGIGGAFINMFGALLADRLELPPQATLEQFLDIAKQTLAQLPGWPTPRHAALRQALGVRLPGVSPRLPTSGNSPVPSAPPPRIVPPAEPRTKKSDWMKDFMEQHQAPGKPPPRVTPMVQPRTFKPAAEPAKAARKDWMKDFQEAPAAEPPPADKPAEKTPASTGKPDWMKDFD